MIPSTSGSEVPGRRPFHPAAIVVSPAIVRPTPMATGFQGLQARMLRDAHRNNSIPKHPYTASIRPASRHQGAEPCRICIDLRLFPLRRVGQPCAEKSRTPDVFPFSMSGGGRSRRATIRRSVLSEQSNRRHNACFVMKLSGAYPHRVLPKSIEAFPPPILATDSDVPAMILLCIFSFP